MHGHPTTGDSPWSAVHQFKVMTPYANELYYTAGDYTFTVPEGVHEICIAAVPGADYSSAGELLKAYTGKTVACVAGNNSVPVGISSITLSGKGAAGSGTYTGVYTKSTSSGQMTSVPASVASSPPSSITVSAYREYNNEGLAYQSTSLSRTSLSSSKVVYAGTFGINIPTQRSFSVTYTRSITPTTGASTTAVVNGTTYTFPGGNGGAASITEHTVEINPAIGATINATLASGGTLSYSYSAYAEQAISSLLGNNFSLSPVAKDVGTYVGGIAAWRNNIPVVPGSTIPVHVSTGGAVNIIWGTGRSFPNSEV